MNSKSNHKQISTYIIAGAGGGKSGSRVRIPIEAPDNLRSVSHARILDLVSEGEIVGLVDGLKSIFLNETPLQNPDGSLNFKDVQVDSRTGTQNQEEIANFPEIESETLVGVELRQDTPYVHGFSNLDLSAIRVRISVPALSKVDLTTGDTGGHSVKYTIKLSTDGGPFESVFTGAFTGKTSSTFERSHRIDLPKASATGWVLRIERLTENSTSQAIQDTTVITSFTEIIDAKLRYPNSALVGIIIDAAQFSSIPTRGYHLKGRIIRVPSNYNPVTREYTGIWDGTFQPAYSNNPAWVYFDMLTHPIYGLGDLIPEEQIDKWALFEIAQYADGLVDDGKGGLEPRFTANVYLQTAQDAYKVLQDLASIFRGIAYWAGGVVVASADRPQDPVYTYTNANVINGTFTYSDTSRKSRHTVALVDWTDMDDFGRGKIEYVADNESVARYGIQINRVSALGATSQGMAHRLGKWMLLSERLEFDSVRFSVGLEGDIAAPGQIIRVMDFDRIGKRSGGRIKVATTNVITIDQQPNPPIAPNDLFTVILPTAVAATSTVTSVDGEQITVSPAFVQAPVAESIWAVESASLQAPLFRVVEVVEDSALNIAITAVQYNPSKFDAIDFGFTIQTPNTSLIPSRVQLAPATTTLTSFVKATIQGPINVLRFEWDKADNAVSYGIQFRRGNDEWSAPLILKTRVAELENAFPGIWKARVWSINSAGITSITKVSDPLNVGQPILPVVEITVGVYAPITDPTLQATTAGWLILDSLVDKIFNVILNKNVERVVILNSNLEDIILADIVQKGAFTIDWTQIFTGTFDEALQQFNLTQGTMHFVSGIPYVPTPVIDKIDRIGFSTTDFGVNWFLRADSNINVDTGGGSDSGNEDPTEPPPEETLAVSVEPSTPIGFCLTDGTTGCSPSVSVGAIVTGGTAPYTFIWQRVSGSTSILISSTTTASTTFWLPSGTNRTVAIADWRVTVADSSPTIQSKNVVVTVTLERDINQ